MKKKKKASDDWRRITINCLPEIAEALEARAKSEHRSISAHVVRLIENDLAAAEESKGFGKILRKDSQPSKEEKAQ